jgi:hypothetical protein
MRRSIILAAFALLPAVFPDSPGCAAPAGLIPTARTEHFRFYAGHSGKGGHVLQVDAGGNERALRDLSARLGVTFEGIIEYQRFQYPEEVAFHAGDPSLLSTGVAHPESGVIQSILPSHPHEIVHILSPRLGRPSAFFVEGLAVELGDKGKIRGQAVDEIARRYVRSTPPERVMASFRDVDPWAAYSIAGSFSRFLVRRYGLATLTAFFRASRPGVREEDAFRDSFGLSLTAALDEWRAALH